MTTETPEAIPAPMIVAPIVLEGRHLRLVPLTMAHHSDLSEVGLAHDLWRWIPVPVQTPTEMATYIEAALAEQAAGKSLPFAQVDRTTGKAIGSTRYMNIESTHRRLEIGCSWITPAWQRTAINTESKYLLLRHAFETLGCIRVELKTDSLNERSKAAIRRIGAVEEGTFRNHMLVAGGRVRHTVYFSIIDSDWPAAKIQLERRLPR
jgi:N-acetyltransferase